MLDIPLAHRRLVGDDDLLRADSQTFDLFFPLDQMHMIRRDAHGPFRLRVSFLADIDDLVPIGNLVADQIMGPGHIGASRIDDGKPLLPGQLAHLRGYAVGGEDDCALVRLSLRSPAGSPRRG